MSIASLNQFFIGISGQLKALFFEYSFHLMGNLSVFACDKVMYNMCFQQFILHLQILFYLVFLWQQTFKELSFGGGEQE